MRLIDADALIKALVRKEPFNDCARVVIAECMEEVRHAPTIEPERKKGEWLDGHREGYGESLYWYIYCSECLYERDDDDHDKDTTFCPNCGADLRKGECE